MLRFAVLALCTVACGRSQSVPDQDLPGLVVESRKAEPPIDIDLAAKDPVELGRALMRPYRAMLAALGPHSLTINSAITVEEAGQEVSDFSDHTQIENGDGGAYHATYTNSADYGRETMFFDGKLYLRPRYQRWHARSPEAPDEPAALRDDYAGVVAAVWDLLGPGAQLTDSGPIDVAGRHGRKISVELSPEPSQPTAESITQRKWREARTVETVSGAVVLDTEKGVPLVVKVIGTIGYTRDGRRFTMRISVDSLISDLGSPALLAPPADADIVTTPERRREVDERDYLLQGIAPPLRRNPDGTAVPPAPVLQPVQPGGASSPDKAPDKASNKQPDKTTDKASDKPSRRKPTSDDPPKHSATPDDGAKP